MTGWETLRAVLEISTTYALFGCAVYVVYALILLIRARWRDKHLSRMARTAFLLVYTDIILLVASEEARLIWDQLLPRHFPLSLTVPLLVWVIPTLTIGMTTLARRREIWLFYDTQNPHPTT